MNEDSINFVKEMLKTEGWRIYEKEIKEEIINLRVLATQQNVSLEDRLWYSALALGREQAIEHIKNINNESAI